MATEEELLTMEYSAKKADKATDGALSEIAREVGMLALEHRKSTRMSFPFSDLISITHGGHMCVVFARHDQT